jgi:exportin-T
VIEHVLRTRLLPLADNLGLLQTLRKFAESQNYPPNEPVFLKNKLALIFVLLLMSHSGTASPPSTSDPGSWPEFFDWLLKLVSASATTSTTSPSNIAKIDLFLRICIAIDEEIVANSQRGQKEQALVSNLKDFMRAKATGQLTQIWIALLSQYTTSTSSPNASSEQFVEISQMILKLFGLYVAWIDINQVVQDSFLTLLFSSFNNPLLCPFACDCLGEIISKGMKPLDKLSLISGLNVGKSSGFGTTCGEID